MSISTEIKNALDRRDEAEFEAIVRRRCTTRMAQIDSLPADVRACVHEYGWTTVKTLLDLGIKKSRHIQHIVETVLNEFSPTRGSYSAQGKRGDGDGIDGGPMKRKTI